MGLILKVLVRSLNQQYFVMLSLSVAEISVEKEALVAARLSEHKTLSNEFLTPLYIVLT